jgi:hypothetical protein
MGDTVGVFNDKEVEELNPKERALLKQHILHHIQTSEEIQKILRTNPKLLTTHPKIRKILRDKARPLKDRLHKD